MFLLLSSLFAPVKSKLTAYPRKKKSMENKNWQRIPTFASNSAKIHEKSFSLIFVVRVESDKNFGSSNNRWPRACIHRTTQLSKHLIDLVGYFQKVEPTNEYKPLFIFF